MTNIKQSALLRTSLTPIIVTTLALILSLAAFSMLLHYSIGWNLFTAFFFWFLLVPMISIEVQKLLKKGQILGFTPIASVLLFYLFVIFMIYSHYGTDFFMVMMMSMGLNLVVLYILTLPRPGREAL